MSPTNETSDEFRETVKELIEEDRELHDALDSGEEGPLGELDPVSDDTLAAFQDAMDEQSKELEGSDDE